MSKIYMDALNFEVKAIETFLGYKFEGSTIEDKQIFADRYKEERKAWTSEMLDEMHVEYVTSMKHEFYTFEDVKNSNAEDKESSHSLYHYVVECGFQICKKCGEAEGSLEEYCSGK